MSASNSIESWARDYLRLFTRVTLARRLEKMGLNVVRQVNVPIEFEGEKLDERAAWRGLLPLLCLCQIVFRFVMDGTVW